MVKLEVALNIVLANTFMLYFKVHSFHWNIIDNRFLMLHNFLGDMYEEIFTSVDLLAENIRMIDQFAPISLSEIIEYATIGEETDTVKGGDAIIKQLITDNDELLSSLNTCFKLAEQENKQGMMDLLATRITIHEKYRWMLKSTGTGV